MDIQLISVSFRPLIILILTFQQRSHPHRHDPLYLFLKHTITIDLDWRSKDTNTVLFGKVKFYQAHVMYPAPPLDRKLNFPLFRHPRSYNLWVPVKCLRGILCCHFSALLGQPFHDGSKIKHKIID